MEFPCTSCGLCCKNAGRLLDNALESSNPILRQAAEDFPYLINPGGACSKLDDNGFACTVYEERPLICNVSELGKAMRYSEGPWFKLNAEACNKLIKDNGYAAGFLVDSPSASAPDI